MAEKEYIEREKTIRNLEKLCVNGKMIGNDNSTYIDFADAIEVVAEQPIAGVQEVRHGKWIEKPYLLGTSNFCSLCGENYGMPHGKYNFCPNCGAKMDKERLRMKKSDKKEIKLLF